MSETKIFYSQYKQDKYLEEEIFKGYENGFFVDVGAHDGISINNTLYALTQGNYNINNFITSLSTLLGGNYTISYNSITYKITISSSTTFTINYLNTTMSRFLGISSRSNTTSILNGSRSIETL